MKTHIIERLAALRKLMRQQNIEAYIIPSSDPHMSEYPAERWQARMWISDFTGSAGTVVVTHEKAGLWTDSRYFIQAEKELEGTSIDLYRLSLPETPSIAEFLLHELEQGQTVGLNGQTYSIAEYHSLENKLRRKDITVNATEDFINKIWIDRPPIPINPIFEMPVELSGKSTAKKIMEINNMLHKEGANCTILSALDEIAWIFNIRCTDIKCNPLAISYAFISEKETVLFIKHEKLTGEIAKRLKGEGVTIGDYTLMERFLSKLDKGTKVYLDPAKTNFSLYNSLPAECEVMEGVSFAATLKSLKNETELKGFHNVMIKDGVALTRFFIWLEKRMESGEIVTEISIDKKLSALREEQPQYIMDSFEAIVGYGPHGAIVHYRATPDSDVELKPESLLLIDSGAHYLDGTTDITRTISLGIPTEQMKKDFTRVLKGMITLAKSKFPEGTKGVQLDILARKALWDAGINYLHGTGHGVGHCLSVHEGPQSIRMDYNPVPLQPGMVLSDEPGLYRENEYGIRIENLIAVCADSETEFGKFLAFETLSLCYIDTKLVIPSMLSLREHAWLNKYHHMVYDLLSPHLTEEEALWLKDKTAEI